MKKLIKGSKAAKDFMAKIRAKRKVGGIKESKQLKKELAAKNIRLPHGYITTKKLSGLSTINFKGKKITQTNSGYYQFYSNIKRKFLKFNSLPGAKEMINNEIISKEIKSKLSDKKLKLPHGYEAIKRSRKVNGVHKDTNSHNVKIDILSGEISKGKQKIIENLSYLYGKLASELIFATTIREKKSIKKELANVKKELNKLK